MAWNYDMSEAPKGQFVGFERKNKDGEVYTVDVYQHVTIWACSGEDHVTITRWLPDHGRWENFATGQTPTAWQPYIKPKHPNLEGK